jgi:hypothetical protein
MLRAKYSVIPMRYYNPLDSPTLEAAKEYASIVTDSLNPSTTIFKISSGRCVCWYRWTTEKGCYCKLDKPARRIKIDRSSTPPAVQCPGCNGRGNVEGERCFQCQGYGVITPANTEGGNQV